MPPAKDLLAYADELTGSIPENPFPRPNDALPCRYIAGVGSNECRYVSGRLPGRPATVWIWASDPEMALDTAGTIAGVLDEGVMMVFVPVIPTSSTQDVERRDQRVTIDIIGHNERIDRWLTSARVYREQGRMCANGNFHQNDRLILAADAGCDQAACGFNDLCQSYWVARYSSDPRFFECGSVLSNSWDTGPPGELPGYPRIGVCG